MRKFRQLHADLLECETDALRKNDERNAAQNGAGISPLSCAQSLGPDQGSFLVEAQGRGCNAASPGDVTDVEHFRHVAKVSQLTLDFKFT